MADGADPSLPTVRGERRANAEELRRKATEMARALFATGERMRLMKGCVVWHQWKHVLRWRDDGGERCGGDGHVMSQTVWPSSLAAS